MLRFTFLCERCGCLLEAPSTHSGAQGRCPTCGALFQIPRVDAVTGVAIDEPGPAADEGPPTPMHAYGAAGEKAPGIRRLEDGAQVVVCPRCGSEGPIDADSCARCGVPFTLDGAGQVSIRRRRIERLCNATLALGVLSLLSACAPIPAPLALLTGWLALRHPLGGAGAAFRARAWTGIAMAAVALVFFALVLSRRLA